MGEMSDFHLSLFCAVSLPEQELAVEVEEIDHHGGRGRPAAGAASAGAVTFSDVSATSRAFRAGV